MPDSKTIDADADLASLVGTVAAQTAGEGALVPSRHDAAALIAAPGDDGSIAARAAMAMIQLSMREGTIDIETLRELRTMAKEMRQEDAEREFNQAMAAAQAECHAVVRKGEAKLGKEGENKGSWFFAQEDDIDDMLRPIMARHGFSLTFDRKPRAEGGGFEIFGTLRHRGGHSVVASFPLPLDTGPGRGNLQAAGSTDSYGRKYVKLGLFNVVRTGSLDDDGAASGALPLRAAGADGRAQALRIKELVDAAGIAGKERDPTVRRAAVRAWLTLNLSYVPADPETDFTYLDIRQEDYTRIVRLLRIEVDNAKAAAEQEARL
jgi:hypothetical protein